jgi:hypothetical protein
MGGRPGVVMRLSETITVRECTSGTMLLKMLSEQRADWLRGSDPERQRQRRRFAARRLAVVDRLVRGGMPRTFAEAWIEAWDASTAALVDFRAAADFWDLGYRYAMEEYRRGHRAPGARNSAASKARVP